MHALRSPQSAPPTKAGSVAKSRTPVRGARPNSATARPDGPAGAKANAHAAKPNGHAANPKGHEARSKPTTPRATATTTRGRPARRVFINVSVRESTRKAMKALTRRHGITQGELLDQLLGGTLQAR